ncbi:nSTAND1 domain-containing NTPase [Nodularia spumigena]|uniref:CHAT domain-containing protein n=1 Tax=Nodularia spumigena UHCC 0060 TaxID=3110300 RepID=A0ABU5USD0_NODSP|nr:CHAT domain-containing protein [Nodularia spumigena]MEA5526645.1 CHAT domain-containing protein [Nodularia spumigena UHCC 0143]MEA5608475.1 CHAT domain-containing protein [Nodularia spumigena UHCC 0060]MEA5613059.1 CHAT domain-containing protein [Nodularia spumigena UHCC 0040]
MSKTVVINLGNGDLHNGFPSVTAQIRSDEHLPPEQFIGSLPADPNLVELYRNWRSIYQALCSRQSLRSQGWEEDDKLEIEAGAITNVSLLDFDELCQNLEDNINTWLKSTEFLTIERKLRSQLNPAEEIRVIIETNDDNLRRLPLHSWDFLKDYPKAELALSRPEYQRRESLQPTFTRIQVRILAILGNSQGIDLQTETTFLKSLDNIAEVVSLNNPSRQEFNRQLWDSRGWDILFFAGHSQTEGDTGRIYINENQINNSLTIEQLEEALIAAIEKGLKLAIFNSCDGLGLANALGRLHIPQVIVMREPVPNYVAQVFFQNFLQAFAIEHKPLYLAIQHARRQLQGLEDNFPGASWLPVICQNPSVQPPTWLQLGGISPCPYRGLFAFREEDAHLFFGTEKFTANLVKAVKKKRFVAVVGASGSGKSSLVFAGLTPQLRQDPNVQWQIFDFRPGKNPFEALATALVSLRQCCPSVSLENILELPKDHTTTRLLELDLAIALEQNHQLLHTILEKFVQHEFGTRLLLIADQFEELYTLCPEPQRQPFLDLLLNAYSFTPAFTIVLTLRADFYSYALSYRRFSDALQGAVQNLGPMNRKELRRVIEEPAKKMHLGLEAGLTNQLIDEIDQQPGHLPLLEFALTQLWSKQQNRLLTHQAYQEIGGVEEALANHAEAVYAQLNEADRQRAQQIFIQLVRLGDETEATRRLTTREEVRLENWDLVTQLASSRLVVTNRNESTAEETVEIVHEALIRSWGRLEEWLLEDGDFLRWREQLRLAIRQWENNGHDQDALLRGKALTDAQEWQLQRSQELNTNEIRFIKQSLELRELEVKQQQRIRKLAISSLVAGLVFSLGLAGFAWLQRQKAQISETKAISSSAESLLNANLEFDGLIASIRAGRRIKGTEGIDANTRTQVTETLQQSINFVREKNRLAEHDGILESVSFSPDGQFIATASRDKTVKIWSLDGKKQPVMLREKTGEGFNSVAFSPDSTLIATGSWDKTAKIWSRDGKLLHTLDKHKEAVLEVAFSPNSQLLATASWDNTVKLWSRDGKLLHTLDKHKDKVNSVTFSPDGKLIATVGWDNTMKLWNLDGKELRTFTGHKDMIWSVSFSPDGKQIATAGGDRTVKIWNLEGKELRTLIGHQNGVNSVIFSPDGKLIATASGDKTVKLWNLEGKELETLYGHTDAVNSVAFSPDGTSIATAGSDRTAKIWRFNSPNSIIVRGHEDEVFDLVFSPNGKYIATASWDKTAKLWSIVGDKLQELRTFKGHKGRVNKLSFSPDGQLIATTSWDKTAKLWNLDGTLHKTLIGHKDTVWSINFSPDGQLIATASEDKTVKLWNRDGELLKTLPRQSSVVNSAVFSPDGKRIATAGWDNTVKIWSIDGKELKILDGHTSGINNLTFSRDGKLIASASWDNTVKIWHLDGQKTQTLEGHKNVVHNVAFSPDGKFIATASGDNTVKIWNLDGKKELRTLRGYKDAVWSVRFSPDGKTLATGSRHDIVVWHLYLDDLDQLLVRGCDWARDYLQNNPDVKPDEKSLCDGIRSIPQQ